MRLTGSPARRLVLLAPLLLATLAVAGCGTRASVLRSSALDYLYPKGAEAVPASDVTLSLPARIGLAFAPGQASGAADPFAEGQKQKLLERIAASFRGRRNIGSLVTIPTHYLQPGGSFENLDRLAAAFGVDLMMIVSYDQRQFSDSTNWSWTYLTIVGAFAVQGEKNETVTFLDGVVYDIRSRALLFRAAGESRTGASATPLGTERELRRESEAGFEAAADQLIANLEPALAAFEEQAAKGTVRGPGTPAIKVAPEEGAIAFGPLELAAALGAAALGLARRRRS